MSSGKARGAQPQGDSQPSGLRSRGIAGAASRDHTHTQTRLQASPLRGTQALATVTSAGEIPGESPAPPGHLPGLGARRRERWDWGVTCLRGSTLTRGWTRLTESIWGRVGERKRPKRVRRAPSGQERTESRQGGDARGDPVLSSRGGAWSPAVGASDAERAGPAAPRCGGGRAELKPRWSGHPTRRDSRRRSPSPPGAQRGTRARAGQGFSVRALRPVPGSFFSPYVSFSLLNRPRSEDAPRETARKTVGMGVSCDGTGWLWDTRDASGGISGLSPGLTPPLATSGNTALALSYGFVIRPE